MPKFSMAIIYGDAAPVPDPGLVPVRTATNVGSLDGRTIPIHKAEPIKMSAKRRYMVLKLLFNVLRGFLASPATIEM